MSPIDKQGGGIAAASARTRAANEGDAIGFVSLGAFADVQGTGVATDYVSERIAGPVPAADEPPNGWATHAIAPRQEPGTLNTLLAGLEPLYVGEFSGDLSTGVFLARTPLTADENVADVINLYRRTDLRTPGSGLYDLITSCALCEATRTPLPAPTTPGRALALRPWLVGGSPDFGRVAFESWQRLTADVPAGDEQTHLYEWDGTAVTHAGRIPTGSATACDDVNGPACTAADVSIGGQGAGSSHSVSRTPHVVSDGSDGHSRTFFTLPMDNSETLDPDGFEGNLYMRVDGTRTVRINVSERTVPASFSPARFLDASADGTRAFLRTSEALTDDATGGGKLYMWSAVPGSEVQELGIAASGGTYTLSFGPDTTPSLDFDATAQEIEDALNALPSIGGAGGSVAVTGTNPFTVTFERALADVHVGQIAIDGLSLAAGAGQQLSCTGGPTGGTGATQVTYQWLSNGAPATGAGASTATYTVDATDAGKAVQCRVRAAHTAGTAPTASTQVSNPAIVAAPLTGAVPVAPSGNITAPSSPSGGFLAGRTMTCSDGTWTGVTDPFAYQWYRNGIALVGNGADTRIYTLQAADVASAATFQCAVTGSNANGAVTKVSSNRNTTNPPGSPSPGAPTATATVAPLGSSTETSHGGHLTFMSVDREPAGGAGGDAQAIIGASADGRYAYMIVSGQLVRGGPPNSGPGLYLWHDGTITYIGGLAASGALDSLFSAGPNLLAAPRQAGMTPDGKHVLFSTISGRGLLGDDHGACPDFSGGCRQMYVYSAETRVLDCVSCPPRGPATSMATMFVERFQGGSQSTTHQSRAITDDGAQVFFSTADPLVPEDVNGRIDAYAYEVASGTVRLLSSGTSIDDSWFLDASADGSDAFFATTEQLVGWDKDGAYDLYDARIGGGFPEPVKRAACSGDACQGAPGGSPAVAPAASGEFRGSGNVARARRRLARRCRRGFVSKRVRTRRGTVKRKCVRRGRAAKRAAQQQRAAKQERRGS